MGRKICECLQQITVADIHHVASHEIHSKDLSSLKLPNMQIMPSFGKEKKIWGFPVSKTLTNLQAIGTYTYDHPVKQPLKGKKKAFH
jgi:hypothetical protein